MRVVDELERALGASVVLRGSALDGRRFADWSGVPAKAPLALVLPRTTDDVSTALRICNAGGQPVVVQGGLTGLAGGACVREGEIAIGLERLRGIEEIDIVSGTMTVRAGTTLQDVQMAAVEAGAYFPLDLGARGSCTIGGVLGTNAGGNRVIKYGMAREHVLGVEAVLPDGRIVGGLHKMIKNNTGLDLRNLLIGSEGTIGIITRAVLRLQSEPEAISTAWCGVPDFDRLVGLLRRAQARLNGKVSAFEVMWPNYLEFVLGHFSSLRRPLAGNHAFNVILETDGADADTQAGQFEAFLGEMLEEGVIADAAIASSGRDAADFWAIRDAPGEFPRLMPDLVAFDISFAIRDLAEVAYLSAEIGSRNPGARVLQYGHLGDGNLHLLIDLPGSSDEAKQAVEQEIYALTARFGGSVSAEHGIGVKKRWALPRSRTEEELSAMRDIRRALDPGGILNRGRVF